MTIQDRDKIKGIGLIGIIFWLFHIPVYAQAPPSGNSQSPTAIYLVDPATGNSYSAGGTDTNSILPLANYDSPLSVMLIDPTTGLPYKASGGGGTPTFPALNWTSPSSLNSLNTWLFQGNGLSGTINAGTAGDGTSRVSPNYLVYGDTVAATGTVASIWVHPKYQSGWDGFRFGIGSYTESDSPPVSSGVNVVSGSFLNNLNSPFLGLPGSFASSDGSAWAINPNIFANANTISTNWRAMFGGEFDVTLATGNASWRKNGIEIHTGASDAVRGYLDDNGLLFTQGGSQGYRYGINFQATNSASPFSTDSTLIGAGWRYLGSSTHQVTALYGIDWRWVNLTAGGCYYAAPNFCIDGSNGIDIGSLNFSGSITQGSTSLSSVAIASPPTAVGPWQGGGYNMGGSNGTNAFPTYTIQAPPSGTTATLTVTSMALQAVSIPIGYVPVGTSGCLNGDVLTVAQGGTTGNTNGTITLTISGGNITAAAVTTAGSYTSMSGATGMTLSGGTGSCGANIQSALTPYILFGLTGVSNTAGSGYVCGATPRVLHGSGYTNTVNTPAQFTLTMAACTPAGFGVSSSGVITGTLAASAMPALTGDVTSSAGSTVTTVSKVNGLTFPASPAGPGSFALRFDPTSSTPVAATADQVGANIRSISGAASTDTALYSDVLGVVLHDKAGSAAVTETLPTPTSLSNTHFAYTYCNNSANTDTITPTTWTIAVNGGAAGASITVGSGVCAQVNVDPFNSSQWDAFTYGTGSGGIASQIGSVFATNSTPSGTQYLPFLSGAPLGSENGMETTAPRAGTVSKLYVRASANEGASSTLQVTLRDNVTSESVTCTIGNSVNTCNDTTHSFSFASGDLLDWQTIQTGTGTSATLLLSFSIQ